MDYKRIYNDIIINAKSRTISGYSERHHIVPKCMKGSNEQDNLVDLTAREHFICHWLLVKIYPKNRRLKHAFWMMTNCIGEHRYRCSSIVYEIGRKAHSNALKGRILSLEHKLKLSKANKNPSSETRAKISAASSIRKGTKSARFKGWYSTPAGVFASSIDAGKANKTPHANIIRWCHSNKTGFSFKPKEQLCKN